MFAGTCIGIVCLSVFLEFLRRSVKEWDRYLIKQHVAAHTAAAGSASPSLESEGKQGTAASCQNVAIPAFRPNLWQQAVRAFLHTAQFTVAYFIMLLGEWLTRQLVFFFLAKHLRDLVLTDSHCSHVLQRLHPCLHLPRNPRGQSCAGIRNSSRRVPPLLPPQ